MQEMWFEGANAEPADSKGRARIRRKTSAPALEACPQKRGFLHARLHVHAGRTELGGYARSPVFVCEPISEVTAYIPGRDTTCRSNRSS